MLGDERREDRRVGDDEEAPRSGPRTSTTHVGASTSSPITSAHAPDATIASAATVARSTRSASAPATTQPTPPTAIAANVAYRRLGARAVAVAEEDEEPRPHRVQLPHVPEVAEGGETNAAVAQHLPELARVERRTRERVRPLRHEAPRDQAAEHRERGGDVDDEAPVEPAEPVDEMRHGRAERQRPDERAEREPAAALVPGRHQLERRWVHARQAETGERAQRRAPEPRSTSLRPARSRRRHRPRRRGSRLAVANTSATLPRLESSAPATKPSCTEIVSHAAPLLDRFHSSRSCGTTAVAENQVVIERTSASASSASARVLVKAARSRRAPSRRERPRRSGSRSSCAAA